MIIKIIASVLVLFLGVGIYNANAGKTINIKKTITINAPVEKVYEMVQFLDNFPKWSAFLEQDPDQKYEVKGSDGTVGAQYHWEGNGGKDLGYQEIVKLEINKLVGMRCDIQKPFEAQPTFNYHFTETENGTTVTQDFNLESSFVSSFFMWLFGAKKEIEATNYRCLELLKSAVEGN